VPKTVDSAGSSDGFGVVFVSSSSHWRYRERGRMPRMQ
jgi:hypothetical protein